MLTRDWPSSRKGDRLCQPQGRFASAAIGDDRADVAPGKCVSEQPLARFDEPVVQSRIPFEGRAGLFRDRIGTTGVAALTGDALAKRKIIDLI